MVPFLGQFECQGTGAQTVNQAQSRLCSKGLTLTVMGEQDGKGNRNSKKGIILLEKISI
jgi:hypothetical protein